MAKIVDKKTFLSLPENTLYRECEPCILGDLSIKLDTMGDNDFYVQELDALNVDDDDGMIAMFEAGDVTFDLEYAGRNGAYENDQQYLVYEDDDVKQLIARLLECINTP